MSRAPSLDEETLQWARDGLTYQREFARGTQAERDGYRWYAGANEHAQAFAFHHSVSTNVAAAVIAVLSPQHSWDQNLKLAEVCLRGDTPRCYKKMAALACEIRDTGMVDEARMGPKVRAFYRAMMGDTWSVVVDRWMLRAMGYPEIKITRKRYEELAAVVHEVARGLGESPSTFQAIVWCQIRGKSF